jgi:hypothetical protein
VHRADGPRIGASRRAAGGEWIVERQNSAAERASAAIPSPPPQGKLRKLFTQLHERLPGS